VCSGPGRIIPISLPLKYFLELKNLFFSKKDPLNIIKKNIREKRDRYDPSLEISCHNQYVWEKS